MRAMFSRRKWLGRGSKLLIGVVLTFGLLLSALNFEMVDHQFGNHEAASRAGALGEGRFLPDFIPVTAVDIRETHNIDTNEVWIRFSLPVSQLDFSLGPCTTAAAIPPPALGPRFTTRLLWWPNELIDQAQWDAETTLRCPDGYYAVHFVRNGAAEVFLWALSR